MKARRLLAFTRRALLQFRHDRRTLVFILIVPLLMMLIFGYTFGGEPKGVSLAIVNLDQHVVLQGQQQNVSFAESIVKNLDRETFNLQYFDTLENAKKELNKGNIRGVLFFPANFSQNLVTRFSYPGENIDFSIIQLGLDGTNPTLATTVRKGLQDALQKIYANIQEVFNLQTNTDPITVDVFYENVDAGNIKFIDYFAPGVISFAIMMVTIMITIILFVNERRTGTLPRLLASPASEAEIVLGYAIAFAFIGIFQSIVVIVTAILIFHIIIIGNIFLALFVLILLAIGHQGLGILLSAGAKNELQAIQFIPLIIFPSILLAGLFWPIESIPSYLQPLSYIIPLRYGIDAERAIMLRGWGLGEIWIQISILFLFALITLTGSIFLLKRRRE